MRGAIMTITYDTLQPGTRIEGPKFDVTRGSIRAFCDGSLDYNPLHLDDDYMKGDFGKTNFGGIIMHGMNNFGLMTRMLTDWAYPLGATHRRLETRWVKKATFCTSRPAPTIRLPFIRRSHSPSWRSVWRKPRRPPARFATTAGCFTLKPAARKSTAKAGCGFRKN